MTENNEPRRAPIVARRDGDLELSPGHLRDNLASSRSSRNSNVGAGKGKSGSPMLLFVILLLSICLGGLGGLGWFSWQQSQAQALLQQRFDELAAKIDSTDESLSQSGAALSVRLSDQQAELTKHWSEIKKLWGVTNDRNKKAIDALEKTAADNTRNIADSIKTTKALEGKMSLVSAEQKQLNGKFGEFDSNSLALAARIEEVDQRIENIRGSQQSLGQSIEQKQRAMESRLIATEKAIASIDAFRRQTNQSLDELRRVPVTP